MSNSTYMVLDRSNTGHLQLDIVGPSFKDAMTVINFGSAFTADRHVRASFELARNVYGSFCNFLNSGVSLEDLKRVMSAFFVSTEDAIPDDVSYNLFPGYCLHQVRGLLHYMVKETDRSLYPNGIVVDWTTGTSKNFSGIEIMQLEDNED